jgi:hypothetical protein
MTNAVYSDLPQVVENSYSQGLNSTKVGPETDTDTYKVYNDESDTHKVFNDDQDTQKISSNDLDTQKVYYNAAEKEPVDEDNIPLGSKQKRRICGLASRTFFILAAIIIVVVIAAAIGGGVGGSRSAKKNVNHPIPDTANSTSTSQTSALAASSNTLSSTTTTETSITTTSVILPTQTLLRDCPSSNNSEYIPTASTESTPMTFLKVCLLTWNNAINGFNAVDTPATSLNDCINLCADYNTANRTQITNGTGNVCNAVCWRWGAPGDTYWPGQCFGFMTSNVTGSFEEVSNGWCDGARWTDQSFGRS